MGRDRARKSSWHRPTSDCNSPKGTCRICCKSGTNCWETEQAFGLVRDTLETILGFRQSVDTLEHGNRQMADAAPAFRQSQPAPKPEDEDWHHHCVAYDGTTLKYYLDSKLVALITIARHRRGAICGWRLREIALSTSWESSTRFALAKAVQKIRFSVAPWAGVVPGHTGNRCFRLGTARRKPSPCGSTSPVGMLDQYRRATLSVVGSRRT